ncbi:MAG: hypothetical protein DMF87_09535 [Acidobacteria bacterium]|nr:MAG: hypothetical protein DMF87_09535 [Acidobacteriota bacterium]
MPSVVSSIVGEFRRYKALGDAALAQLKDEELDIGDPQHGTNSAAILVWHIGGNLRSRFTDFLTADGEKPWRQRDEEFTGRTVTRDELFAKWNGGWDTLFGALEPLTDEHLQRTITIRGQSFAVHDALHRSLAHICYHVGQLVFLAKMFRREQWKNLSIPLGKSETFNKNAIHQDPASHAALIAGRLANEK